MEFSERGGVSILLLLILSWQLSLVELANVTSAEPDRKHGGETNHLLVATKPIKVANLNKSVSDDNQLASEDALFHNTIIIDSKNEKPSTEAIKLQNHSGIPENVIVGQVNVTSKPLLLFSEKKEKDEEISTETVVTTLANEINESYNANNIRPSYQPLMEDIMGDVHTEEPNATLLNSSDIKSADNKPNQISYDKLPDFSEKDLNKRRLNHWRLRRIMKGSEEVESGQPEKHQGLSSTPYTNHPSTSTVAGEFPVDLLTLATTFPSPSSSPVMQQKEEREDKGKEHSSSKLRTFFSWFSNALRKPTTQPRPPPDPFVQRAKEQQNVLPFALNYRGDFIFW